MTKLLIPVFPYIFYVLKGDLCNESSGSLSNQLNPHTALNNNNAYISDSYVLAYQNFPFES